MTKNTDPAGLSPSPEPTVQVPVSLIERARDALRSANPDKWAVYEELHALLSQPTPSAEPPCARCGHDVDQHGKSVTAGGIGCALLSCPCGWFIPSPAAPHRIEDMARGTAEDAIRADEREQWASYFENSDASVGNHPLTYAMAVRLLRGQKPFGVAQGDPSTIRDVTPPTNG